MAGRSQVADELLRCRVVDQRGRGVGRVVAVIHKALGVDVLIEHRTWCLRRRSWRCPLEEVTLLAPGVATVELQRARAARELPAASGAGRRS